MTQADHRDSRVNDRPLKRAAPRPPTYKVGVAVGSIPRA